jgi:hypothetical protein
MNLKYYILILASFFLIIMAGCDSPSDSKASSVSPPSLISPADRDTNVTLTPTFTWTGSADILVIAKSSTFSNPVYSVPVTGTSFKMPGGFLDYSTIYYWHAGITSGNTVYWSEKIFMFTTIGH